MTSEAIETPHGRLLPTLKSQRWTVIVAAGQFVIVGLVLAAFHDLKAELRTQTEQVSSQTASAEALTNQTTNLAAKSESLTAEIAELRQDLAMDTQMNVIFLKILIVKSDLDPALAQTIARHVHHYSALYKQDPDVVLAMIAVESRFDPKAVSHKGALGLMQVMPQWAKVLGISDDLRDPEASIKHGLQIFGFYRQMYKDLELALTAYNRGPGAVDFALQQGKDPKNEYAPRVLKTYDRLKSMNVGNS